MAAIIMPSSPFAACAHKDPAWGLDGANIRQQGEHVCANSVRRPVAPGPCCAGCGAQELLLRPVDYVCGNATASTVACEPPGVMSELKGLLQLAVPLLVDNLSGMGLSFVTTAFVGHLNKPLDLSALVLATSIHNISGLSVLSGLASAMETLAGQAYGAQNYPMLGMVLQRATLACVLVCLPIIALWSHISTVLPMLGQDSEVAALAGYYMRWYMPSVLLFSLSETSVHHLLAQRVALPSMTANLLALAMAPVLNWLFIYRLGWGLDGAGAAVLCCTALVTLLLLSYRTTRDTCMLAGNPRQTWFGLSWAALAGWPRYLAFGLPAVLMVCVEWWWWEAIILMAGALPNGGETVGIAGLAMQIAWMPYLVSYAMGTACSTRVANALGAGQAARAKRIYRLAVAITFGCTLAMACAMALWQDALLGLFTHEPHIGGMVLQLLPFVAVGTIADGQVAVLNGVLRASGRQLLGAAVTAGVMWGLGLPLAWLLGFRLGWGVRGLWAALVGCTSLQALIFHTLLALCDWEQEVQRARLLTATEGTFRCDADVLVSDGASLHHQHIVNANEAGAARVALADDAAGDLRQPLL